jgi:hypothetical protein
LAAVATATLASARWWVVAVEMPGASDVYPAPFGPVSRRSRWCDSSWATVVPRLVIPISGRLNGRAARPSRSRVAPCDAREHHAAARRDAGGPHRGA